MKTLIGWGTTRFTYTREQCKNMLEQFCLSGNGRYSNVLECCDLFSDMSARGAVDYIRVMERMEKMAKEQNVPLKLVDQTKILDEMFNPALAVTYKNFTAIFAK